MTSSLHGSREPVARALGPPVRARAGTWPAFGLVLVAAGVIAACGASGLGPPRPTHLNGFALAPSAVPADEILPGGPPRDGIPALDHPIVLEARHAGWSDEELVIGVAWAGSARAYPVSVLEHHELVNDTLGGRPILVSYCPLCGTGIVFDREVAGRVRRFGVSGLLYRSDLLMYDQETESLWSQIAARAVTGPSLGARLTPVRARMTRWGTWRAAHPDTTVMSAETGHRRRYGTSPYGSYAVSPQLMFPAPLDGRYHPKMPTIGVRLAGGPARAYPAAEIAQAGGAVEETFAGHRVRVAYDADSQVFDVEAPRAVEVVEGYWFAWMAFHPESSVFVSTAADASAPARDPDHSSTVRVPAHREEKEADR